MSHRLIEAATALADALDRENAALVALDLAGAAALLEAKQAAADAFAAAQTAMSTPAPPRDLAERLRDLADANRRLLERAIRVQGRVLAMVAQALPKPPAPRYGATGMLAGGAVAPVVMSARI